MPGPFDFFKNLFKTPEKKVSYFVTKTEEESERELLFTESKEQETVEKVSNQSVMSPQQEYQNYKKLHHDSLIIFEFLEKTCSVKNSNQNDLSYIETMLLNDNLLTLKEEMRKSNSLLESLKKFNQMIINLKRVNDYLDKTCQGMGDVSAGFLIFQQQQPNIIKLLNIYNPLCHNLNIMLDPYTHPAATQNSIKPEPNAHDHYKFPAMTRR